MTTVGVMMMMAVMTVSGASPSLASRATSQGGSLRPECASPAEGWLRSVPGTHCASGKGGEAGGRRLAPCCISSEGRGRAEALLVLLFIHLFCIIYLFLFIYLFLVSSVSFVGSVIDISLLACMGSATIMPSYILPLIITGTF